MTKELVDSQSRSTLTEPASDDDDDDNDDGMSASAAVGSASRDEAAARAWLSSDVTWKQGDKCRAIWSDNHQYVYLIHTMFHIFHISFPCDKCRAIWYVYIYLFTLCFTFHII